MQCWRAWCFMCEYLRHIVCCGTRLGAMELRINTFMLIDGVCSARVFFPHSLAEKRNLSHVTRHGFAKGFTGLSLITTARRLFFFGRKLVRRLWDACVGNAKRLMQNFDSVKCLRCVNLPHKSQGVVNVASLPKKKSARSCTTHNVEHVATRIINASSARRALKCLHSCFLIEKRSQHNRGSLCNRNRTLKRVTRGFSRFNWRNVCSETCHERAERAFYHDNLAPNISQQSDFLATQINLTFLTITTFEFGNFSLSIPSRPKRPACGDEK